MECDGYSKNVAYADCKIARWADRQIEQKRSGNQKKTLAWTWSWRSHQGCIRRNSSNERSIIFKRGAKWVYQASWKVDPCKNQKTEKLLHQGWSEDSRDSNNGKYKVQILWWKPRFRWLQVLPWDISWWSKQFLEKKQIALWLLCRNLLQDMVTGQRTRNLQMRLRLLNQLNASQKKLTQLAVTELL